MRTPSAGRRKRARTAACWTAWTLTDTGLVRRALMHDPISHSPGVWGHQAQQTSTGPQGRIHAWAAASQRQRMSSTRAAGGDMGGRAVEVARVPDWWAEAEAAGVCAGGQGVGCCGCWASGTHAGVRGVVVVGCPCPGPRAAAAGRSRERRSSRRQRHPALEQRPQRPQRPRHPQHPAPRPLPGCGCMCVCVCAGPSYDVLPPWPLQASALAWCRWCSRCQLQQKKPHSPRPCPRCGHTGGKCRSRGIEASRCPRHARCR